MKDTAYIHTKRVSLQFVYMQLRIKYTIRQAYDNEQRVKNINKNINITRVKV